jgi:hypothetical protein
VEVAQDALRGWIESTLEHEIAALVHTALQAARRAFIHTRRAADGSRGDQPVQTPDKAGSDPEADEPGGQDGAPASRRLRHSPVEAFRQRLDRLAVGGVSQLGYVTVIRDRDWQFRVHIRRGMLGRLTGKEIGKEIQTALSCALASYDRQYVEAHRSAFGADPGAEWG